MWDAQHLYKYNGNNFEHFYDKPWTAECWWDVQVPKDTQEEGRLGYTNLKQVIWHESFVKLLDDIAQYSHTGYSHTSMYDKVAHWLFPIVLIEELHNLTKMYKATITIECFLADQEL
ncbi:hypothetical protein EV401DRAFT_1895696 [Pisolithus croceorrhizus]|nr:hypothetical protein EV401DRAFT_1895696 [Pisolithus croceorrhizus]